MQSEKYCQCLWLKSAYTTLSETTENNSQKLHWTHLTHFRHSSTHMPSHWISASFSRKAGVALNYSTVTIIYRALACNVRTFCYFLSSFIICSRDYYCVLSGFTKKQNHITGVSVGNSRFYKYFAWLDECHVCCSSYRLPVTGRVLTNGDKRSRDHIPGVVRCIYWLLDCKGWKFGWLSFKQMNLNRYTHRENKGGEGTRQNMFTAFIVKQKQADI